MFYPSVLKSEERSGSNQLDPHPKWTTSNVIKCRIGARTGEMHAFTQEEQPAGRTVAATYPSILYIHTHTIYNKSLVHACIRWCVVHRYTHPIIYTYYKMDGGVLIRMTEGRKRRHGGTRNTKSTARYIPYAASWVNCTYERAYDIRSPASSGM